MIFRTQKEMSLLINTEQTNYFQKSRKPSFHSINSKSENIKSENQKLFEQAVAMNQNPYRLN